MGTNLTPVGQSAILMIRTYQKLLSPLLGQHCRFYPSCSQYTLEAIQEWGLVKGMWLGTKRICRCHPLNEGGIDPVPRRDGSSSIDLDPAPASAESNTKADEEAVASALNVASSCSDVSSQEQELKQDKQNEQEKSDDSSVLSVSSAASESLQAQDDAQVLHNMQDKK